MNPVHTHLLLNHVPIVGSAFGVFIIVYGTITRNKSAVDLSYIVFIISALFALPVFLTGEPAEESIEDMPGIIKASIETHEESAEVAFWMMEGLGLLSLITWIINKKELPVGKMLSYATLLFSLVVFGAMAIAGNDGGKIRHTEISTSAPALQQPGGNERLKEESNDND